ncbi:hypothetical protein JKG47_08290 [Acidithiobacillus sp. MC6.1]|nr:hypothetical protein [Acidithiobacillus sp. MC6.1]
MAQVDFAFSVGDGVNAYYLPAMSEFVYADDGLYYEWAGDAWLYSNGYYGPWFPLPAMVAVPVPLLYGPPPPVFAYQPYFDWWRVSVAPWYRLNHPGWWMRHHAYLRHYRIWRARVIPLYRGHPFYRGAIHPVLRPLGHRPFIHGRRPPVARRMMRPMVRPYRPMVAHPLPGRNGFRVAHPMPPRRHAPGRAAPGRHAPGRVARGIHPYYPHPHYNHPAPARQAGIAVGRQPLRQQQHRP